MESRSKKIIHFIFLMGIGGVFVYAGVLKVINPAAFATDIDHYQILPWPVIVVLALYLPWLELFGAIALMFKGFRVAALSLMLAMSALFLLALLSAARSGLDIDCGCFGGRGGHLGFAILRDVGIMLGLTVCLWMEKMIIRETR